MARLASESRQLYRRASRAIPGGVNSPVRYYSPYPMFVASAKGARFRTIDGDEFLDYCMAYGALIDGHASPEVIRAVQKTAAKGSIFGQPTLAEVELAETISSLMPSMQMVRLVNSGTEATMHALRLARGFTGKKKILKFEGGFHGSHDSVLVKPGRPGSITGRPSSEGIPLETSENTLVAPYNDEKTAAKIIRDYASQLAAVIVEPVAGNMGPVPPATGFLGSLRRLTRENRVVLIFDEVITGFRLSLGGAQEYYHIIPDLTILGKIVGGGFPLAAFGGRREIMRKLSPLGPVYQAGTFSGNRVSVTAGLTTLRSLKRRANPAAEIERKIITTSGDVDRTTPLFSISQKGIFEREVDQAVLEGKVDFAVHSMKDVPTVLNTKLTIASVPERGATGDVLVSKGGKLLKELRDGKTVGTSSLLRAAQLRRVRPTLRAEPIRGNVDTRVEKVERGEYDAVILAEAGLARLGMMDRVAERLSLDDFMPAPGQGALAVIARRDNSRLVDILRTVELPSTRAEAEAERELVKVLEGGCKVPVGAIASAKRDTVQLTASIFSMDGKQRLTATRSGPVGHPAVIGRNAGEELLRQGAKKIEETWRTVYR